MECGDTNATAHRLDSRQWQVFEWAMYKIVCVKFVYTISDITRFQLLEGAAFFLSCALIKRILL